MIRLYIDPGTGSMLFSIAIGLISAGAFFAKKLKIKLQSKLLAGKTEKTSTARIPFLIYSDHKRYWNVFKPVCDEFEKRGIDAVFWTSSPDDPALEVPYEHVKCEFIGEGNKGFAKLNLANADVVLATTPGLEVYQWKRSKDAGFYVHIYHAADNHLMYRMFGLDFYDAVLTTGEIQEPYIRKLEEMRGLPPKEIVRAGSTYLDGLALQLKDLQEAESENPECNRENSGIGTTEFTEKATSGSTAAEAPGKAGRNITVLLAPSWGKNSILCRYGENIFKALKNTGFNIIVRPHPQSYTADKEVLESLKAKHPDCEGFTWNRDNDNFKVLSSADILITDFSGIVFDYVLTFDRPVIYTSADIDTAPFDGAWFTEEDVTGYHKDLGIKLKEEDFENLKEIITSTLSDRSLAQSRAAMREKCWSNRGHAAEKAVDYLVEKQKEIASKA